MKKNICTVIAALTILFWSCYAQGQDTIQCKQEYFSDSLLDKLTGNWIAVGTVMDEPVVYQFSVQWILNHQFLELTFSDSMPIPEYTARVLIGYNCEKERYVVHWLDNFGGAFSETLGYGSREDQSIVFSFDYPNGELQNTFSFDSKSGQWTSHSVMRGARSEIVTFGRIVLSRKEGK